MLSPRIRIPPPNPNRIPNRIPIADPVAVADTDADAGFVTGNGSGHP
jgi:hypothetical protein